MQQPVDRLAAKIREFERLHPDAVNPHKQEYETELQKLQRFAKLREGRAKAVNAFGDKTYSDVLDNMSQEEIDYYAQKRAEAGPEQLFREGKEAWYFHDSSYYMRDAEAYDGRGCYNGICSPECEFYIKEIDEALRAESKRQQQRTMMHQQQQEEENNNDDDDADR